MRILVTGAAGFIGNEVCSRLLERGDEVIGLDNLNHYYDVRLKLGRLRRLGIDAITNNPNPIISTTFPRFLFQQLDLADSAKMVSLFATSKFDAVVHLAAQAGVRHSLNQPQDYIDSNVTGFLNILEGCRHNPVQHLVFASSSSVYGQNAKVPFSTNDPTDHPVSIYAATKKANELMASSYSHLFQIPATGLRFFTVYGPWGRPDMAPMLFADAILSGRPIDVFNHGNMKRDFTFVQDIVNGTIAVLDKKPIGPHPFHVFNIGRGEPVDLMHFIQLLEDSLGTKAKMNMKDIQPGDVPITWADTQALFDWVQYKPSIKLEQGVSLFADWYKGYWPTLR